ncbi:MAG: hypothetical protein ACR2JJ_08570 [Sphingomicrobium sp.]
MGAPPRWGQFDYSVFGLRIRSDLKLPELVRADPRQEPDVRIRLGQVPVETEAAPGIHPMDGAALLKVSDVASYCVTDGSEIVVQPEAGAAEQNIRLFLLGSAMGLVLHQRRLLPLHANAVEIRGKAVAFMGASGEGKSSLAAWFHDHHFQIIADDVCVVRFGSGGQPVASPGVPRLRLWKEVLEATGRQAADYERSYGGDEGIEKYDVPVAAHAVAADELQLGAVYLLGRGKQFLIQQLHGVGAVEAVIANTYRGSFISVVGDARAHFEACLKLVDRTPVFEVFRTWDFSRYSEEVREILAHATGAIGPPPGSPSSD